MDRNTELINQRILGASWSSLAKHFNISETRCRQIWDAAVKAGRFKFDQAVETARAIESEKMDRLSMIHWQKAADPQSALILMKIADRRAAMQGLDAPVESRVMYDTPVTAKPYDLSKLSIEKLRMLRAALSEAATETPVDNAHLLEHNPTDDTEEQS
jgi:hypothetical protein